VKSQLSRFVLIGSLTLNALFLVLLAGGAPVRESRADAGATEKLVPYMEILQHLSHKLGLSIQAKNEPLASFYLQEIDETVGLIRKKFPTYDNMEIGSLTNAMIQPSIDPLRKQLKAKNWVIINAGYTKLIDSCNDCHGATDHEFIQITSPTGNPFNQTFSLK
jgi:hypothetical protein